MSIDNDEKLTGAFPLLNGLEWGLLGLLFIVIMDHESSFQIWSISKISVVEQNDQ